MNTDLVAGVSDRATDTLYVLFNTDVGRAYLRKRQGVPEGTIAALSRLRLLRDRQCPRRDQDGEAAPPGGRRRHHHRRH